jgi:hypothetical protein
MPVLSNPTLWRTHPHTIDGYLVVYNPAIVFSCSVNQTTFSYPILQLIYDSVTTGAYTDVKVGQLVKVSSNAGVFKGWARVHTAPTSTILYVGAIPIGDISFANNDLIEVLDDYRIQNKISINAEDASIPLTYKDYTLVFSDQTLYPPPVCNLGPHFADFVDDSGYIYVSLDLTASCYAVADGATISSYSANLAGGTVTSGSVASGVFTVRYGAGKRWLLVTITDSNGKTHTGKLLVVGCEKTGTNAPVRCLVQSLGYQSNGWDAEFRILASAAVDTVIPEQAMVIYFEKESYGGTAGSLNGFPGREHIKFVGWVSTDGIEIEPLNSDLSIRCIGPLGVLNSQGAFGGEVSDAAAPANWQQMANLTLFRFIHYVLHWHSTMLDVCDLELPTWASSTLYYRIGVPEGLMGDTINELGSHYNAPFTCDRQGRFFLRRDWMMMTDAERAGVTVTVALAAHDWEHVSVEERSIDAAFAVRGSGVLASRTDVLPYLSVAPGKTPGQGGTNEQLNNQLVSGQTDINVRTGRQYGRKNSKYGNMTIAVWPGGMVADPAWGEKIQFTLDDATNKRGIEFSSTNFLLHEVRIQHDHGAGVAPEQWVMEMETFGVPGEMLPVPVNRIDDIGYVGLPEWQPIDDAIYDPRPTAGIAFEDAPALYMMHANYITRTRNHTDGSPNYEIVLSSADLETKFGYSEIFFSGMALDPWNPKMAAYVQAYSTDAGNYHWILYIENLDGPPGTQVITTIFFSAEPYKNNAIIRGSINTQGLIFAWYWLGDATNYHFFLRRINKTASMTSTPVIQTFWQDGPMLFVIGYHGTGKIYATGRADPFWFYGTAILKSSVSGSDFGRRVPEFWRSTTYDSGVLNDCVPTVLHLPYTDNPNDELFYLGHNYDGAQGLIRHNVDDSWSNVGPNIGGNYYWPIYWHDNLHSFTGDRQILTLLAQNGTTQKVFTSENAGDTWEDRNAPAGASADFRGLWGWPFNQDIMMMSIGSGSNRGIWWTNDLISADQYAITWANAMGDWETVTGETFTNPINVVPVWVP